MDSAVAFYSIAAGVIAAGILEVGKRIGLVDRLHTVIALALSLLAGVVVVFLTGGGGNDFFTAILAAIGASQAIYALVLTKFPPAAPPTFVPEHPRPPTPAPPPTPPTTKGGKRRDRRGRFD